MAPKLDIIFEDPQFVVINKPAGLPVHATHDPTRPHVWGILQKQLNQELVLFHRLDLETSGLLIFGRDASINRYMTEAFRDRLIKKTYWAVVDGRWPDTSAEVKTFIKKITGGRWANVPKGKGGDPAHSLFRMLKSNGDKSWLEVKPTTGRTHQIRLHCLETRHPILGDRLYGRADVKNFPMALHARGLEFDHPVTGQKLELMAEAPDYWKTHWLKGL